MSDDELAEKLRGMVFGVKSKPLIPAELQAEVMQEEKGEGIHSV